MGNRWYHKHDGCAGSHKIISVHKSKLAVKHHDKEIAWYNKREGISTSKKPVKKVVTKKYKKPTKLSKAAATFGELITGKKEKVIELPIDENGVIIADLTKIQRPLYIKTITIVDWQTRKQEVVEFKFKSLPSGKGIEENTWKRKLN